MTKSEIEALVQPILKGSTITEVEDFGDIFAIHFVNDEYYKSNRIEDIAAGAGPIIFIKKSKEIFKTSSGQTAEGYVNAYRKCGDIYGFLSDNIGIYELPGTLGRQRCILSIKKILGFELSDAKSIFEILELREVVEIKLKDEWQTKEVVEKLSESGFVVRRLWNNRTNKASQWDASCAHAGRRYVYGEMN